MTNTSAVQFVPPLTRPGAPPPRPAVGPVAVLEPAQQVSAWAPPVGWARIRGWRLAWVLTLSAPAALTTILSIWSCFLDPTPAQLIQTAAWALACAVLIWAPPLLVPHRAPRPAPPSPRASPPPQVSYPEPRQPVATDYLPVDLLHRQVHGIPGQHLSVARFGASAIAGIEGERRTAGFLDQLMQRYPAMRVIHGARLPGSTHAYVDHLVIVGNTVITIDSALWPDGYYWWDGHDLFNQGTPCTPPNVASAAETIRSMTPMATHHALVLLHAPNRRRDRPSVENRFTGAGTRLPILNPGDATAALTALFDQEPHRSVVDVPVLACYLRLLS